MALTAMAIKSAKGRDKQYKLTDSGGLHLLVLPSGQRYWRMNYRYLGKYRTLAFGVWPDVALADARAKRDEARKVLAKGIDPSEQAKLDKIAASVAAANTNLPNGFAAPADKSFDMPSQRRVPTGTSPLICAARWPRSKLRTARRLQSPWRSARCSGSLMAMKAHP